MYNTIDLKESARALEARVRDYWHQHSLAKKSEDFREGSPRFVFFEGPPTANGKPGIPFLFGHRFAQSSTNSCLINSDSILSVTLTTVS